MIVVFVVDTSPSMGRPAVGDSGLSRLDLAKMAVEDLVRQHRKMRGTQQQQQQLLLQRQNQQQQRSSGSYSGQQSNSILNPAATAAAVGATDHFLLLSTSRQYPDTSSCAAGGRLLVGFGPIAGTDASLSTSVHHILLDGSSSSNSNTSAAPAGDLTVQQQHHHHELFSRELKGLTVSKMPDPNRPWPEDAGGAAGLNVALSAGLQQLSRFRLAHRETENFGMGRLPSTAIPLPNGNMATAALQPACLILVRSVSFHCLLDIVRRMHAPTSFSRCAFGFFSDFLRVHFSHCQTLLPIVCSSSRWQLTDGACLRLPPKQGGGQLQLHFGSQPLREFYQEPFRWDQQIFVLAVGANAGVSSSQYLHPQLRTLCEVTGGAHWAIRGSSHLHDCTNSILRRICPPMPKELPLPDPLFPRIGIPVTPTTVTIINETSAYFINGGPVCCFHSLEQDAGTPAVLRASLLYVGSAAIINALQQDGKFLNPPLFCLPESYFPSKKLDTLPPRSANPKLFFSKVPSNLGSKSFEPTHVIKMLHRLDQLIMGNRKSMGQPVHLLQRDVYVCDWIEPEGGKHVQVTIATKPDCFPVFVPGAGRASLSEDGENSLNIGILHVPQNSTTLGAQAGPNRLATLTILPPEPHILLPLLIRAAEAEHRIIKKIETSAGTDITLIQRSAAKAVVALDESWKTEFRAYLFRLPPYYQFSLKRCLRVILPSSVHSMLPSESMEMMAVQCFSKVCHQKIRNGEQIARDNNDRLDRQEVSLRRSNLTVDSARDDTLQWVGYGQYDPRMSVDSYLAALRHLPAPWRVPGLAHKGEKKVGEMKACESGSAMDHDDTSQTFKANADCLGELPTKCLMAYYESRRRWIFGGPGLTTRGLHCEGVQNDGSNAQACGSSFHEVEECPLTMAGIGVSVLNQTSTSKMGEYRERLLFSRSPVVGYGSNDSAGVSATTAIGASFCILFSDRFFF
jgi:hypothetical protein